MLLLTPTVATLMSAPPVLAFCNDLHIGVDLPGADADFHPGCPDGHGGHQTITVHGLHFLGRGIVSDVTDEHQDQDNPWWLEGEEDNEPVHFDNCRFSEAVAYVNARLDAAVEALDPRSPDHFTATDHLGKLMHPIQDFYAHSNWVELGRTDLIDPTAGRWNLAPLQEIRPGIVVGELPPEGLPRTTFASLAEGSAVPVLRTPRGPKSALVTGWRSSPPCLDVRPASRLRHGKSDCSRPTSVCLHKDRPSRPLYQQAYDLATRQTSQEWCRLLSLLRQRYGPEGMGPVIALWRSGYPHPAGTSCARDAGPIEVRVEFSEVRIRDDLEPEGFTPDFNIRLALYTADGHHSIVISRGPFSVDSGDRLRADQLGTLALCVDPDDDVVATVQGWEDDSGSTGVFDEAQLEAGVSVVSTSVDLNTDDDMDGVAQELRLSGGTRRYVAGSRGVNAAYTATSRRADSDRDGICDMEEELAEELENALVALPDIFGSDPGDGDTDGDGLNDGAEVDAGSDPVVADTDGDSLSDGREVALGTDPVAADSDGDTLGDASEVDLGTNPGKPDVDRDGEFDARDLAVAQEFALTGSGLVEGRAPDGSLDPVLVAVGAATLVSAAGAVVRRRRTRSRAAA